MREAKSMEMNLEKLGLEGFPFDKPLLDEKSEHDLAIRKKKKAPPEKVVSTWNPTARSARSQCKSYNFSLRYV